MWENINYQCSVSWLFLWDYGLCFGNCLYLISMLYHVSIKFFRSGLDQQRTWLSLAAPCIRIMLCLYIYIYIYGLIEPFTWYMRREKLASSSWLCLLEVQQEIPSIYINMKSIRNSDHVHPPWAARKASFRRCLSSSTIIRIAVRMRHGNLSLAASQNSTSL